MATYLTRRETFKSWPYQSPSPIEMAAAGFFHRPKPSPDSHKQASQEALQAYNGFEQHYESSNPYQYEDEPSQYHQTPGYTSY